MNSDLWSLVLARLPVENFDSVYQLDKHFSSLIKNRWRLKTFTDEYKKCNNNALQYMVIISFKDSYHCEGFFVSMTIEDKQWFQRWFISKFGRGITNFIMYECNPDVYTKDVEYDTTVIPGRVLKNDEIIIQGWIENNPKRYSNIGQNNYDHRYRFSEYEKYFRWTRDTVKFGSQGKIIKIHSIFSTIRLCNQNYVLPDWNTLIDYDKVQSFDTENSVLSQEKRNNYHIDCDKCSIDGITSYPYASVKKWFEIERVEKAKTKTMHYNQSHEFYNEKQSDKIFIRWTDLKGLYFAIYHHRNGDDFYAICEDTIGRTYITISCIGGHPNITYPGYVFSLSDGSTSSPEGMNIGRILPMQKEYYYRKVQYNYVFDKPPAETSPNQLIDIVFMWANSVMSSYGGKRDSDSEDSDSDSSDSGSNNDNEEKDENLSKKRSHDQIE